MPCYHPMIREEQFDKWETAADGHKYHPARIFTPELPEEELYEKYRESKFLPGKWQLIPCGKCLGCRLEYSREWANRGYLEAQLWENNWFVTITYDEDHVPTADWIEDSEGFTWTNDTEGNTLVPKDLTRFIKNVRQTMARAPYFQTGIRFMACGEYGSEGGRPHYHIIFFNLNLPIDDLHHPQIKNKEIYYRSHIIERAWGGERYLDKNQKYVNPDSIGISNISNASWNNIAYTARYITKKINGPESEQLYAAAGKIKEFMRVSRMPGIGQGYYDLHKEEIYRNDEIIVKNKAGVISCKPPKYFDELYKKENPEKFEEIRKNRERRAKDKVKVKDSTTSIYRQEQREIEEREKEEASMKLIRQMEKASG